jgi:hypothetical protein
VSGTAKSDFVAAEEIKMILHGRDTVEQERILRWVAESLGLATVASKGPGLVPPPSQDPGESHASSPSHAIAGHASIDIKSFVAEKQPKSDMQFAATVAYFHHFVTSDRRSTITKDDLQTAARLVNRKRFPNPATPLDNAVTNGYLDRPGRGEYRLNAVGENLVAMTLPGANGASENGGNKVRKRRAVRKSKSKSK